MLIDRHYPVYSASSTAITPPATPTDVFTLSGSLTSNVYVMKMGISTFQTTAGTNIWHLLKRSAADTGGTSTLPPIVPFDINNPASAATVNQYSVNPVLGAAIGDVWVGYLDSPAVTTVGIGSIIQEVNFMDILGQPLSLLSPADVLAWNFGGAALPPGLSVLTYVTWYETSKT